MRRAVIAALGAAMCGLLYLLERPRARFVLTTWPNHVGVSRVDR